MSIGAIFRRRAESASLPPPPLPPGEALDGMPAADAADMLPAGKPSSGGPSYAGLTFLLEYCDAEGKHSKRRITLQEIYVSDGYLYLRAFCHERQDGRTFRGDRMLALVDLRTGQRHDTPLALLTEFSGEVFDGLVATGPEPSGQRRAMNRCRDGIRILMFLARCDGTFHPDERQAVAQYCRARCEAERWDKLDYDLERLLTYADRQYPDRDTFISCVERIVEKADTGEHLRMVLGSSALVVMADGTVTGAEAEFSRDLRTLMADAGFEFRVDVDGSGGKIRVSVESLLDENDDETEEDV